MPEDIAKIISQSKDHSLIFGVRRRRSAVKKLGEIGIPRVVIPLVESLKDEDNEVKANAFKALSQLVDPDSLEILRNLFLKKRSQALWQIITKQEMFPESLEDKVIFFAKADKLEYISSLVKEDSYKDLLIFVINSKEIERPSDIISAIINSEVEISEMEIIKLFVDTKNDALFDIIDRKGWYPKELSKKIMFLLMTERYDKIITLLDGQDFRQILNIIFAPKFPQKKQVGFCLSHLRNQAIIDEICNIYLREGNQYIGEMILKNNWAPHEDREKVLFYLKTQFLTTFFKSQKVDPFLIGGYLEIIHIRESLMDDEYVKVGNYLHGIAEKMGKGKTLEAPTDSPLIKLNRKVKEYIDCSKSQVIVNEVIQDYLQNKNPLLKYFLVKVDWEPGNKKTKVDFYLNSSQDKKIILMGGEAVEPLFEITQNKKYNEEIRQKSLEILNNFKNFAVIEKIFEIYFRTLEPNLTAIIKNNDWKPASKTNQILFYIFSGQMEKYKEIEPQGHKLLLTTYKNLDLTQKAKFLETLKSYKTEAFDNFILDLFETEKNPRIFTILSNTIKKSFKKFYKSFYDKVKKMPPDVLEEVVKTLSQLKNQESSKMLYQIARVKKGYLCLWILKLLEEARWQPNYAYERSFFYELYKIKDEMLRILQNRLVDEDAEIREKAALTIAKIGDEKLLPILMKYIEDPVDNVRKAIAFAIGHLCALAPHNALEQIESFRIGSIYMIFNDVRKAFMVNSEKQQAQIIARNYDSGNAILRIFSITTLAGLRKGKSAPTLLKALRDNESLVKKSALKALADVSDESCKSALFSCLDDKDKENRILAAKALSGVVDKKIIEKIEKKLNNGDFAYSDGLITVLGQFNPSNYLELFKRIIHRPDFDLDGKEAAVIAISKIENKDAIDFLIKHWRTIRLVSDTQDNWLPYIEAFKQMGKVELYPLLDEMYKIGNWEIRKKIIEAMGNIPDRLPLVTIIKAFDSNNGWIQMAALKAFNHSFNNFFNFKETEKDLKFIAAIITRLKKFNFNEIEHKELPIEKIMIKLLVKLLINQLTRFYIECKEKISPEAIARAKAKAREEKERKAKEELALQSSKKKLSWQKLKSAPSTERLTGAQLFQKIKEGQKKHKKEMSSLIASKNDKPIVSKKTEEPSQKQEVIKQKEYKIEKGKSLLVKELKSSLSSRLKKKKK